MTALFETDTLFVTLTSASAKRRQDYTIVDGTGAVVATARGSSAGGARALRLLHLPGTGRYDWDLLDAGGNRLLAISKPAVGLRKSRPEVCLADGTLLGRAVPAGHGASLQGPDGTAFGELTWALGQRTSHPVLMYRVLEEDGTEVGEIAHQAQGDWGFHVDFKPGADLAVRAMTIAWTICKAQERTT